MDGIAPQSALDRGIEAILRSDRRIVLGSLVLVIAVVWLYLWRDAEAMARLAVADAPKAGMAHAMGAGAIAMAFVMWSAMMVGMMLPSAAPTILLYGALVRKNGERGSVLPAAWVFTSGYLVVWTAFSLVAALLQVALEAATLTTPMTASAGRELSAALLIAAGIYQWLPLKEVCLRKCRSPIEFFGTRWRTGAGGAFLMGVEHGCYCIGCCWMLMLLLFVAGVMNLIWVALIAGFVFVEKLLPAHRFTSRFAGAALLLSGLVLVIR